MMDPSDAVLVNQARLGAFDFIVIALYLLIVAVLFGPGVAGEFVKKILGI